MPRRQASNIHLSIDMRSIYWDERATKIWERCERKLGELYFLYHSKKAHLRGLDGRILDKRMMFVDRELALILGFDFWPYIIAVGKDEIIVVSI
jgi:hypothetical protein